MNAVAVPILEVKNLKLYFRRSQSLFGQRREVVRAVDGDRRAVADLVHRPVGAQEHPGAVLPGQEAEAPLALVALALGALGVLCCGGERSPEGRTDVLLITIDTRRDDHVHSYGW